MGAAITSPYLGGMIMDWQANGLRLRSVADTINSWGLGVMLGIYVAGDSGGFLNPAIYACFCLYRGWPWRRFPIYLLAQLLGGFVAAGVIYGNYITGIDNYEGIGVRTGRSSVLTHLYSITLSLGLIPASNASCPGILWRKALRFYHLVVS